MPEVLRLPSRLAPRLPSGSLGVRHEVAVERLRRRPVDVLPYKIVTDDLSQAADLLAASPEARVRDGHVDEIEESVECRALSVGVTLAAGSKGTRHLAAGIAELLHQRHRVPAA